MKSVMLLLPFVFAVLTSCTKGELLNEVPAENNNTVTSIVNKTLMLDLVNKIRKTGCNCGNEYFGPVPAVTWNNQLETAAALHSDDMYRNKYFSHTGKDGSNAGVRIDRVGYNWITYGENLASGQKNEQEVVSGWLSSPGHCKNIMNKLYKEMGVGRVGNIWTQEFAVKK